MTDNVVHLQDRKKAKAPASMAHEIGISRAWARKAIGRFLYCADLGGWLHWSGGRWAKDSLGAAREDVKGFLETHGDADYLSKRATDAILSLASCDEGLVTRAEDFDANPDELNTPGGIIDLRTGSTRPHTSADRVTKITKYAPDCRAKAPRFLRFLCEVQPDSEVRGYMRRMAGCAATGHVNEQVGHLLHGAGQNGKNVFTELVAEALGEYASKSQGSLLTKDDVHPQGVASLRGRRLVYVSETPAGARLSIDRWKSLTGDRDLTARYMGQNEFTFRATHTLWLVTNFLPRIDADDDAAWRRAQVLAFNHVIPEERKDKTLFASICNEEGPAVLAWILEGAREWYAGGLAPPAAIKSATAAYRTDEDVIARFLEERCELAPGYFEIVNRLWASFAAFAKGEGEGEERRIGQRDFAKKLSRKGFGHGHTGSIRTRTGLRLRQHRDEDDDEGSDDR